MTGSDLGTGQVSPTNGDFIKLANAAIAGASKGPLNAGMIVGAVGAGLILSENLAPAVAPAATAEAAASRVAVGGILGRFGAGVVIGYTIGEAYKKHFSDRAKLGEEIVDKMIETRRIARKNVKTDTEPKPQPKLKREGVDITRDVKDQKTRACFPAGTPLLTPDGWKAIEQLCVGDLVLARNEYEPDGVVEPRLIEAVFVDDCLIYSLRVSGHVIETTAEHPFYVVGRGWCRAQDLRCADRLVSHNEETGVVEEVAAAHRVSPVYNVQVAGHRTYFVGCDEWGFSVWAHNACLVVKQWRTIPSKLHGINVNHYTVGVSFQNGASIETDLEGQNGTPAIVSIFHGDQGVLYRVGHDWTIQLHDQMGIALLTYMRGRLGPSGEYNTWYNSCAGYVWDVLNQDRKDVPDLPATRPYPPRADGSDTQEMRVRMIALYKYLGQKTGYTSTNAPPDAPK